jgi:PAS domain S-box-containing protein
MAGAISLDELDSAASLSPNPGLLLTAVEATGEAILITSAELEEPGPRIEYANPAFTRMTGYEVREVLGLTPRILQGPLVDRTVLARMKAALREGQPFQGESLNYRKDGSTYFVEWLITPVRDPDGTIVHWVSAQRDITERRRAEEQQGLLVRELHHRVKNTLSTVQAVLNATLRSTQGAEDFRRTFANRVASLARTHMLITEDRTQEVSFEGLVRIETDAYDEPGRARVSLRGPKVRLPSEVAVPIGMAMHELATNAVRHGALSHAEGRLEVTWSLQEAPTGLVLHWEWNEHDGPPVALPTHEGFGSELLKRVLTYQVKASVEIRFDPDGLRVNVALPLPKQG